MCIRGVNQLHWFTVVIWQAFNHCTIIEIVEICRECIFYLFYLELCTLMLPLVSKYIHKDIFITVYDLGFWMMVVIANGLSFLISPIGSNAFSLNYVWEKCRHILFLMIFSTFYIHSMNGKTCELYKVFSHIYERIYE